MIGFVSLIKDIHRLVAPLQVFHAFLYQGGGVPIEKRPSRCASRHTQIHRGRFMSRWSDKKLPLETLFIEVLWPGSVLHYAKLVKNSLLPESGIQQGSFFKIAVSNTTRPNVVLSFARLPRECGQICLPAFNNPARRNI